jgi:hypothetical protein
LENFNNINHLPIDKKYIELIVQILRNSEKGKEFEKAKVFSFNISKIDPEFSLFKFIQ